MEIFIILILIWLFARSFRKKSKGPVDKWTDFENAERKNAKLQKRYDNYMMSLPELAGDGSYSQDVEGELAYRETLDNFGEWIERYHPGENEINVILEVVPGKGNIRHTVRIEAGDAVIGFIARADAEKFADELLALGGTARASAQFRWSPNDGNSTLMIDAVRPLRKL